MKGKLLFVTAIVAVLPTALFAQTSSMPLHGAIDQAASKLAATVQTPAAPPAAAQSHSWVARHPVLTGTLIGLGIGVPIGIATCWYPTAEGSSCADYTYPGHARMLGGLTIGGLGAGIGAGVAALVAAAR
jgi:hypothetical protein